MARALVICLVAALAGAAIAAPDAEPPGPTPLVVAVGETVVRDVGIAVGYRCDDPSLIEATMRTEHDVNVFVVTGVKVGTTQCRAGTDPNRPSTLFEVRVVPRASRRPPSR